MSEHIAKKLRTEEAESIFRPRTILFLGIMGVMHSAAIVFDDELSELAHLCLSAVSCTQIAENALEGLFGTQIDLLLAAVGTLTIITSFLNIRYLGANYKFWLFKRSPYMLTPQEIILLMIINLFFGQMNVVTGLHKPLAALSYLISWFLFLYFLYQMYVYIIKVSHMFCKLRKQLADSCLCHVWNDMCDHIYKKLMNNRYANERNSYLIEESEVIIQMIVMYRENKMDHDKDSQKIENLKNVLLRIIKNEVYVRCDQYACLKDVSAAAQLTSDETAEIEKVYQSIAEDIISRGNLIMRHHNYQKANIVSKTAEENLMEALEQWMGR